LLVDPTVDATLMDIARIQNRLQTLLGVPVDVLTPRALPEQFRNQILKEARPI
jgi:predicted nucleotidyltransferase